MKKPCTVAAGSTARGRMKRPVSAALLAGVLLYAGSLCAQTAPATAPHPIANAVPYAAQPLPLSAVRLTGGPLKHAQDLTADYLLQLEPDRMLYYLRQRAGLEPKARQPYSGWDGAGRQLTGHIAGHYLSAVSYMYAATGDARFKERADYMVAELKEIQDKQQDGYIGGLMANPPRNGGQNNGGRQLVDGKERFQELAEGRIDSSGFDLNGMWSPWYVQHKLFAGLRDAYRLTGNRTALEVEIKFAGWADGILSRLSETQIQRMLGTEFGGMNESMADLYADTGDLRWLRACDYFEHKAIVEPLARHEDILDRKHGNTQVPKLLGELMRYVYSGNKTSGEAASFFWDAVVDHHSFATGGHGHDEYFGQPDKFNYLVNNGVAFVDGRTDESCNVYNMLKMTRTLFALKPDIRYADFMERALFNHVLASIDPEDGRVCYMVPVGRGVTHEYQNMFRDFTCCVGTGMESHALHGDGLFYESGDKLWVNFYAPATAQWKAAGLTVTLETNFPEGQEASLRLTLASPRELTIALRRPAWAGDGFGVSINGQAEAKNGKPGTYVELKRTWKSGDTIALTLPKTLHMEPLPDAPHRVALLWGPLVLAGDLGPENRRRGQLEIPVFVAADQPVSQWLQPVADKPGTFRTHDVGRVKTGVQDVEFTPFYRLHRRTYGVYWDLFTSQEWQQKAAEYAAEQDKQRKLEAATVAFAQPGEMQPERDFNYQGEESGVVQGMERPGRRGGKWFSFDLPVDPAHPMKLIVTYNTNEQATRSFEVQADGRKLADQTVERAMPARFMDVEYAIPADLVKEKQKLTIRFQAAAESEIAGVYGLRMIRADAER